MDSRKSRATKIIVLFLFLIAYIVFIKIIILPNEDYYAGPLLALSDQQVGNDVLFFNAITYFFPVVWLISLFVIISKKDNA